MLVKAGEGIKEYKVIRNGIGEIQVVNKFGPDETANRCSLVAELWVEPGQSTGYHDHTTNIEIMYMLEGELVCIEDGEEKILKPGDTTSSCNGSKHQITNRTDKIAKILALVIN